MHGYALFAFLTLAALASERFPFVIPGDDALPGTATDMTRLSPTPAGKDGFVRVQDGHFATDSGRLRIWGVNVCFGANFPRQQDAPKIAAHLAKLGINGVRFHHHDGQNAPTGLWRRELENGKRVFDPDAVDRLDRYLAELHSHGIYANLNLHCSRELSPAEGFPSHNVGWRTSYNKYTLYFDPDVQAAFRQFCRDYLLHVNPYRGLRRVDDPGIAMLEITNENSFAKLGPDIARKLPLPYRKHFETQWNAWLAATYADDAALRQAWRELRSPQGEPVISGTIWTQGLGQWNLHAQNGEGAISTSFGPEPRLGIAIAKSAKQPWEQQLLWNALPIEPEALYTLRFRYRGDAGQTLSFGVETAWPAPWKDRGLSDSVKCRTQWQSYTRSFVGIADEHPARFALSFGGQRGSVEIADFAIVPGGYIPALPAGQSLESANIGIPDDSWGAEARADVRRFMAETELAFVRDTKRFLRQELGVKVPISCTQVNYHPPEVAAAAASDFTDLHSYWQHPLFPGRMWDEENWVIRNEAIERNPFANQWPGNSMLMRAGWRHFGRPFTYSEWNSGEPMIFGASVVPLAATIASLQDWDAIFFFEYDSSSTAPFRDYFRGHFSMNGQPAKLAMLCAAANLFRRGDLRPLSRERGGPIGEDLVHGAHALSHRIGMRHDADRLPNPPALDRPLRSPQDRVVWDHEAGFVQVHTPNTWLVQGIIAERSFHFGEATLEVGPCENDYGIVLLTSLDAKPVAESARLLLTAVGSAENTGMIWNADKTSVARNWGNGPSRVNAIPCELRNFPKRQIFALDGRGQRVEQVEAFTARTLWYELR
jgi:hypothetical protein